MSLWKKTKELFKRLKGDDTPPSKAPAVPAELPVFFEPLPQYQQDQRDFAARARATRVVHSGGTFNKGRNRDKRKGRAVMISRGASPRVAKRKQRDGIEFDAVIA